MARRKATPIATAASAAVAHARWVLRTESRAIDSVLSRLGPSFDEAVEILLACKGRIVVTGMGKAGFIAQKLSATFASTGTPSLYVHPAEALHGDLGRITKDDAIVAMSNSGDTDEITRLLPALKRIGAPIIAITGQPKSILGIASVAVLDIGDVEEACPMNMVPTSSALAMLALGDALAMCVLRERPISQEDYAQNHPGGSIGQRLRKVSDVMRSGPQNPVISDRATLKEALGVMTLTPGRPGATSVVDGLGRLVGIFTDGDLRRLTQEGGTLDLDSPVSKSMTRSPRTVRADMLVLDAAALLRERKIDQVPVVDEFTRPIGLLDVQDLLAERLVGEA